MTINDVNSFLYFKRMRGCPSRVSIKNDSSVSYGWWALPTSTPRPVTCMVISCGLRDAKRESVNEQATIKMPKMTLFKIIEIRAIEMVTMPTIQYQSEVFSR